MNNQLLKATCACLVLLAACGDNGSDTHELSPQALSPPVQSGGQQNSSGTIQIPTGQTDYYGNLLLTVEANDDDGIDKVELVFGNSASGLELCAVSQCGNQHFRQTISGLNPGLYGAQPGELEVHLRVRDTLQNQSLVSSITLNWSPPNISNIDITRSRNGDEITVNWENNPQLLRYNVYLASVTGVNRNTYQQLPDGVAKLAVQGGPQTFNGLSAAVDYYLLLVGVDGSGESTNLPEFVVPASGSMPNRAPIVNDDSFIMDEDDSLVMYPLDNDSDADGDALTITQVYAGTGDATIQNDAILYIPPTDYNGHVYLTYSIEDGHNGSDNGNIDIQINPINDAPQAADDQASTAATNTINIEVLANDSDVDGDPLTVSAVGNSVGTVIIESDSSLTYQPSSGFAGLDRFSYTIIDGVGGSDSAFVEVTVGASSRQPITYADHYVVLQNTQLSVTASQGVLVNDADPDGGPLTVLTTPLSNPAGGSLNLLADGSFEYTPTAGFSGTDSFEYAVTTSNNQTQSAVVTLDVRVIPVDLTGESNSISGQFLYIGLGDLTGSSGRGSGLYRLGDCVQDQNTQCHMVGVYTDADDLANNTGPTGTFAFTQSYSGAGNSPVVAASVSAGSNFLSFQAVGDASFELTLFPHSKGIIKSRYPESPFADSLNFGVTILPQETCTGLPSNVSCSIGQLGLIPGAQLTAPLDKLTFSRPGVLSVRSDNASPEASVDNYSLNMDATLTVSAPGVLSNDSDPDIMVVGDVLQVAAQFNPALGALVAIGVDEYRQKVFVSSESDNKIYIFDRVGTSLGDFPIPGGMSNKIDIQVAPEVISFAGNLMPPGTLLIINGESEEAEIYAVDGNSGAQLGVLNTSFGDDDVVGGAYNPVTQTMFLLRKDSSTTIAPELHTNLSGEAIIAEIDLNTGGMLNQFPVTLENGTFSVGRGDLDINNETGSLYIVSDNENDMLELSSSGEIIRQVSLPTANSAVAGLAISQRGEHVWLASVTGEVIKLGFSNTGVLPHMQSNVIVQPLHGEFTLYKDGSFNYFPMTGFVGTDVLTYEITDQKGKNSLTNVFFEVTN